tara:strand:- start:311 stop:937 length:627 start_codon:yes stop_codon:yes gene_type:complete
MILDKIYNDNDKFANLKVTFNDFAKDRYNNSCKQFTAIFIRNWQYLKRNPRSWNGIVFNGFFTGLLTLSLYIHIGRFPEEKIEQGGPEFIGWIYNLSGLGFLLANNISFSSSSSVILQMPLMVPVFKREVANNMYTPSTYYLGRFFSHMILQLFYPVSFVCIVFWGLNIDESWQNWLMFVLYAGLLNLAMNAQGYFCGVLTDDDQGAN